MRIKIIEVGSSTTAKSKKGTTYSQFNLKYEADGKARDRKIMSFDKENYALLSKATAGEQYEVNLVQNGDFWDWKQVDRVTNSEGDAPAASKSTGSTKGNWETPEERARRQVYIMRQNALTNAVAYCQAEATVDDILAVAEQFAAWSADVEGDDDDGPSID